MESHSDSIPSTFESHCRKNGTIVNTLKNKLKITLKKTCKPVSKVCQNIISKKIMLKCVPGDINCPVTEAKWAKSQSNRDI